MTEHGDTAWAINYRLPHQGPFYLVVDGIDGCCGPFQLDGQIIRMTTGVVENETVISPQLAVRPNPAGGAVGFHGFLPVSEGNSAVLEVYDVSGRRVTRVGGLTQGVRFSFVWDGRDAHGKQVAAGVYFARLTFGRQVAVQKFVLIR